MERQSEGLDDYPEVKAKVTAHLDETNEQLKRLEQCLEAWVASNVEKITLEYASREERKAA